jgi:hypothetical protein
MGKKRKKMCGKTKKNKKSKINDKMTKKKNIRKLQYLSYAF